ncbi:hypothetical protein MMPV_001786 [Pyropia vietnamensis]
MACLGFAVVPALMSAVFPSHPAAPSYCQSPPAVSACASPFLGRHGLAPAFLPPVTRSVATRRRSCSLAVVVSASSVGDGQSPPSAATPAVAAARGGGASARRAGADVGGSGGSGGSNRLWRQWAAAAATALALLVSPGAARAARRSVKTKEAPVPVATEAVRYDGKKQLDERERAVSLVITGGAFAGLFGWAYLSNRKDDREESVRVREEVERLEKVKQEFVEVDGDDSAPDDADMMAELRKRLAADSAAGTDPVTPGDDPDAPPPPPPSVGGADKS